MRRPLHHIIDYLVLSVLISAGIILILIFSGNPIYQRFIIISISLIYIVWGALHHLREHTFQAQIMVEYVLFALLGTLVVIGLF